MDHLLEYAEANKVLEKYRLNSIKPILAEDYIEIKRMMRIAQFLPESGCRFIPEFKIFHKRYRYWLRVSTKEVRKLQMEVFKELKVDPMSEDESKIVADVVIKQAMRYGL